VLIGTLEFAEVSSVKFWMFLSHFWNQSQKHCSADSRTLVSSIPLLWPTQLRLSWCLSELMMGSFVGMWNFNFFAGEGEGIQ
jgi:hypothetical protein